jgi:hypothetical protein
MAKPMAKSMAKPMAKPMGLVRLAPRKVAGVTMIDQEPYNVDDLEERLYKLMNTPYSK